MKCDQEADIFGLISKVEHLKKERSVLWLREFKEWMDHSTEDFADVSKDSQGINLENKYCTKIRVISRHHGRIPRYSSGSLRASRAKRYRKSLECNGSCVDQKTGMDYMKYVEGNKTQKIIDDISSLSLQSTDLNQKRQDCLHDEMETLSVEPNNLFSTTLAREKLAENGNMSTLDITHHMTGSTYPGSPPHYQKDVLYRRHNLVEEILQLSADSYSVASSDSTSSCSEDDNYDSESECSNKKEGRLTDLLNVNRLGKEILECGPKGTSVLDSQPENGSTVKFLRTDESTKENTTNFLSGLHNGEHGVNQIDRLVAKRKHIKRFVSLPKEESCNNNGQTSLRRDVDISDSTEDEFIFDHLRESFPSTVCSSSTSNIRFLGTERTLEGKNNLVEEYFSAKLSDSSSQETCRMYMSCDLILQNGSTYEQR